MTVTNDVSQHIAALSPEKRKLLDKLLEEKGNEFNSFPLSFAQERLWFFDQLESGKPVYNIATAIHLKGLLNVTALKQSLNEIVRRHETLRTTFATIAGKPVQFIAPSLPLALQVVDLQQLLEIEQSMEIQQFATNEARQPFDLTTGPLIRVTLLQLGNLEHILLLTIHHIVSDGWSMGLFVREIGVLYEAFSNGRPSPLPELPIQYVDFVHWQRQWLQGEMLEGHLSYWKKQLAGASSVLELPSNHPRPAVQKFRGARHHLRLSQSLTKALKDLSQAEGVTLFMTLLAAFKSLLHRYTGQEDILVGSPIANRDQVDTESLIGFFVNTLVLYTNPSDHPSFQAFLQHVREVCLDAYTHQALPFEKLVETLQPERDLSRNPLFQVMFVLQNSPMPTLELSDLTVSLLEIESGTTQFDLTLNLEEQSDGLKGWFGYNTDLFDDATIAQIARHFQTLLEGIIDNPQQRISELPLLSADEQHQLVVEWNNTPVNSPQDQCIHQQFEAQVKRTPERVAVVCRDQQLTYQELNNRANQLAHHLQKLGVGPEVLVGIYVERSVEMIVGLLGILKAGGAYVPLDPIYPSKRLVFMLNDAQVSVLLTTETLLSQLPELVTQVVSLDGDRAILSDESEENPTSQVKPENLAYVMYTSGSTGRPKGVMIEHNSVLALLQGFETVAPVGEHLIGTSVCPFAFDVSVWEFFSNLNFGGTLHILQPETFANAELFVNYLIDYQVTNAYIPPALLSNVVSQLEKLADDNKNALNRILVGVEPIKQSTLQRLRNLSETIRIVNGYGPTEATIFATCFDFQSAISSDQQTPIGTPISGYKVYLVDSNLQPVPIGVKGEIYIGGVGLARGYLNRPDLTAEKFISNPFNHSKVERIYKTGDLAKYLPNGNIEFIGRIDNQVKLRGFRIELGEIEAVLSQYPQVSKAVVVVREDQPGDKRLVAYLTPDEELPTLSQLRYFLKEKLPGYMLPNAFVVLESLPLTPNGKINRRALPAPDPSQWSFEADYVPPRNSLEEFLSTCWSEILGLEKVGIHDNFFELGGHSLLAIQVITRLREFCAADLPLRHIFEFPTIGELSEFIESTLQNEKGITTSSIRREPDVVGEPESRGKAPNIPQRLETSPPPLSFAQQRFWQFETSKPDAGLYNMSHAYRIIGDLNIEILERSLGEIVKRHEILRSSIEIIDGKPVQVINPFQTFTLSVVDLRKYSANQREAEVQRVITEESQRTIDLTTQLWLFVKLLRLSENEHFFLLTTHHIVADGWSMGVFLRELTTLYAAFSSGKPSPLPELPIQYADFALWQRQWLQGKVLESRLNYFKQKLGDSPPMLNLAIDRPRPEVETYRGTAQSLIIPEALTKALKGLSQREKVTLPTTLLATFNTLLFCYRKQEHIIVGLTCSNRSWPETEGLIGCFSDNQIIHSNFSGNLTFRELLTQINKSCLNAYFDQNIPIIKLIEELNIEDNSNHYPLCQATFNFLKHSSGLTSEVKLPGLNWIPQKIKRYTVPRFDLSLIVLEKASNLEAMFRYKTDLFDSVTITKMMNDFQDLLEMVSHDSGIHINSIKLSPWP